MTFSKALLHATYQDGKPGRLTKAHEKAEHHHFKKEFLFKNKRIPKELYIARLIQQFLIIKELETQLTNLPKEAKSELNAFFALSYLEQLWRTSAMKEDLRLLNRDHECILESDVTRTTESYLRRIKTLSPKTLLAHFLLHIVGFIHGGAIIQKKYIEPSNQLTPYLIPASQYDFSSAVSLISNEASTMTLYHNMMREVDEISLTPEEYEAIFSECNAIYEIMVDIYDDLCRIHMQLPKIKVSSLAILSVSLIILAFIIKCASDFFNLDNSNLSTCNP